MTKISTCCSCQKMTIWEHFLFNVLHFSCLLPGYIFLARQSVFPLLLALSFMLNRVCSRERAIGLASYPSLGLLTNKKQILG